MIKRDKPKVGQIMYRLNHRLNNSSKHSVQELVAVKVVKVGRKYFSVVKELFNWEKPVVFHLSNWQEKTDYSVYYELYESQLDWENYKESRVICEKLGNIFNYGSNTKNLTVRELRSLMVIVERGKPDEEAYW